MTDAFLERVDQARQALACIETVDDAKELRDKAEAARAWAKNARLGLDAQNHAAEIKVWAERKAGELLAETTRPGNPQLSHDATIGRLPEGVTRSQSSRWQTLADIPEDDFRAQIAETKQKREELTTASLLRAARRNVPDHEADPVPLPTGKYRCIVIDPPWPVQKIIRDVRPQTRILDYPTMTLDQIRELPIPELAADGCHIYLWVTHRFMPAGLDLFDAWEARYECSLTWVKPTGMTPYSWNYNTEHVLFGRIGTLPLERMGLKLGFLGATNGHSVKPDEFYERVLAASPEPRLEMFARTRREGFTAWGNEVAA